jgi:hypothetical protein
MTLIRRKKTEPKETPPDRPSVIELPADELPTPKFNPIPDFQPCPVCGSDRSALTPGEACPVDGFRGVA